MAKSKIAKSRVRPVKVKRVNRCDVLHIYSTLGGIPHIPSAAYENCVLVPLALTAFIPESAIRKFAADKPFVVQFDDAAEKSLMFFSKHGISFPLKDGYKVYAWRKPSDFHTPVLI